MYDVLDLTQKYNVYIQTFPWMLKFRASDFIHVEYC